MTEGEPVIGLHIPSHRPAISFQPVNDLPTNPKNSQQQYDEFQQLLIQTYGSVRSNNPGLVMKKSLISLALFGYGNVALSGNETYRAIFERFQLILQLVLPDSIGFERIEVRMPDVVLICRTGEFSLDAMSGGINALFSIAWQIHMYGSDKQNCTVIIDEPENHLHPSIQRSLLPNLAKAFPNYRFIVASHSPFIVTSDPRAAVYGLLYDDNNKIISQRLESADLSASPDKVLREILDVPTTMPIWVEERIKDIFLEYDRVPESPQKVENLFESLKRAGVSEAISAMPSLTKGA